jgi:hypothetical protein
MLPYGLPSHDGYFGKEIMRITSLIAALITVSKQMYINYLHVIVSGMIHILWCTFCGHWEQFPVCTFHKYCSEVNSIRFVSMSFDQISVKNNSIGLINTQYRCDYTRAHEVTSCCNMLTPVRQLSSNSRSSRMCFSQMQWVLTVEHYLASRFYLTCQNEFRATFSNLLCQTNR